MVECSCCEEVLLRWLGVVVVRKCCYGGWVKLRGKKVVVKEGGCCEGKEVVVKERGCCDGSRSETP